MVPVALCARLVLLAALPGRATASRARLLVDGEDVADCEVARTLRQRSRGLLGRDGLDGALVISPCRQVHTVRMRFALDVAFLDRTGTVLRTATLAPGRMSRLVVRSRTVVEAEAGAFDGWGLRTGARVEIVEA